jgi:hypothetical protein
VIESQEKVSKNTGAFKKSNSLKIGAKGPFTTGEAAGKDKRNGESSASDNDSGDNESDDQNLEAADYQELFQDVLHHIDPKRFRPVKSRAKPPIAPPQSAEVPQPPTRKRVH